MCSGALYCCKLDTGVCEYSCQRSGFGEACDVDDPRGKKCKLGTKCCFGTCIYNTQTCIEPKKPEGAMCKPDYVLPCEGSLACLPLPYRTIRDCQEAYQCCNYKCVSRATPCQYDPTIEDPWINNSGGTDPNEGEGEGETEPGTTEPEPGPTEEEKDAEQQAEEERQKYLEEQLQKLREQLEQQVEDEAKAALERALAANLQKQQEEYQALVDKYKAE